MIYTAIELFAGGGGLALGLERAGFRSLGLIELDKDAAATLRHNRPAWRVINEDLADRVIFAFPAPHAYKPVLRDCPPSEGAQYGAQKRDIFALVPPGGYWRDIPEEIARPYMKSCWYMGGGRTGILRRLSLDEPSLTVLTSPSQKQTERCHPLEPRPFSVRENARWQSFPDEWEFCGSMMQQYKQVGNAVPVNLAYEIARAIKTTLGELKCGH